MNSELAQRIRQVIAEIVGFDLKDISDEDSFIADYRISYTERKALLDRLNQEFSKELAFDSFVKLDKVSDVVTAYQP